MVEGADPGTTNRPTGLPGEKEEVAEPRTAWQWSDKVFFTKTPLLLCWEETRGTGIEAGRWVGAHPGRGESGLTQWGY